MMYKRGSLLIINVIKVIDNKANVITAHVIYVMSTIQKLICY